MSGRYLLDTCAIIWIALNEPIKPEARLGLREAFAAKQKVSVSPISAWELGLLSVKGRLPTTRSAADMFREVVATPGIRMEALSPDVLLESCFLPGRLHGDPADRILIATARAFNLILMTRDQAILDYADQGLVRALPC